jgi:hypothetical protein
MSSLRPGLRLLLLHIRQGLDPSPAPAAAGPSPELGGQAHDGYLAPQIRTDRHAAR